MFFCFHVVFCKFVAQFVPHVRSSKPPLATGLNEVCKCKTRRTADQDEEWTPTIEWTPELSNRCKRRAASLDEDIENMSSDDRSSMNLNKHGISAMMQKVRTIRKSIYTIIRHCNRVFSTYRD